MLTVNQVVQILVEMYNRKDWQVSAPHVARVRRAFRFTSDGVFRPCWTTCFHRGRGPTTKRPRRPGSGAGFRILKVYCRREARTKLRGHWHLTWRTSSDKSNRFIYLLMGSLHACAMATQAHGEAASTMQSQSVRVAAGN